MKKKKIYLLLLIGLLFIVGCGKKENVEIKGRMISLSYSYSSTDGKYRDYKMQYTDGVVTVNSYGNDTTTYNATKNVDSTYLDELEKILDKYNVKDWNGFNEQGSTDEGVGFSLEVGYSDGSNISATGFAEFPEEYESFQKDLINLFNSIE